MWVSGYIFGVKYSHKLVIFFKAGDVIKLAVFRVESELNEYKKGIVDGSWLQHQYRRMIERNMNYMKSNKMDEGQEAESLKAVPSGSSNNVEASCKCTKSRGGDISGNKTNKVMSKMFSQPIEKEEKNTDKMNLAKLLDW